MSQSFRVDINTDVLKFAISNSGYEDKELYYLINDRFGTNYFTLDYYKKLLDGSEKPLYTDLKKMDSFLKRGIPFYFLPEIPKEDFLANFRSSHQTAKVSPEIETKLRDYHYMREELDFLMEPFGKKYERNLPVFTLENNPIKIADELRKKFDYDPEKFSKSNSKDVFEYLRLKIEELNIFIFKKHLDYNVSGSILLSGDYPPLIVLNSNEDKNREIFTLLHEFGHYLLGSEEIDQESKDSVMEQSESWCNSFAYHFMVPKEYEITEKFRKENKEKLIDNDNLNDLSKKYKVSRLAFMYRFLALEIISLDEFFKFKHNNPYKTKSEKKGGGGGNWHLTNRDQLSREFISLVNKNYKSGNISASETFKYLGIKNMERLPQYMEVVK